MCVAILNNRFCRYDVSWQAWMFGESTQTWITWLPLRNVCRFPFKSFHNQVHNRISCLQSPSIIYAWGFVHWGSCCTTIETFDGGTSPANWMCNTFVALIQLFRWMNDVALCGKHNALTTFMVSFGVAIKQQMMLQVSGTRLKPVQWMEHKVR